MVGAERIRDPARGQRRSRDRSDTQASDPSRMPANWNLRERYGDSVRSTRPLYPRWIEYPPGAYGRRRCRGRRILHSLLRVLCGADLLRAARTVAGLRSHGDVRHRRDRRGGHVVAQFAVLCDRRTRRLDLRGDCRARQHARGATSVERPRRRPPDRDFGGAGVERRADRAPALRPRSGAARPRHPLCSLSGDRRLSRRLRLSDVDRRLSHPDRYSAECGEHRASFRRRQRGEISGRNRGGRISPCRAAILEIAARHAGTARW